MIRILQLAALTLACALVIAAIYWLLDRILR